MVRFHSLDHLRSFALLLGLLFHAAIVYADDIHYAIQNAERSQILSYFCYWVHSFRMPMFYILAGFFSSLVWEKKGSKPFIRGRASRVFVPTVLGLLFLAPIQYYLMALVKNPELEFINFVKQFFTVEHFEQSHIWFLVNLLAYSLLFIFFPKTWLQFQITRSSKSKEKISFLFAVGLGFLWILCFHFFFPKGEEIFGTYKLSFFFQLFYFFIGAYFYYQGSLVSWSWKTKTEGILWISFSIVCLLIFRELELSDPLWKRIEWVPLVPRLIHLFLWILLPFLWTYSLVSIFFLFAKNEGRFGNYLLDASLPVYLVHHPVSLGVAFFLIRWELSLFTKFTLHLILVFMISFGIYHFLIRPWSLVRIFFGLKPKL